MAAATGIKLYTNPGSRGKMCEWQLAELGLKYEEVNVDMRGGEHKKPAYLKIHPFGKVPALQDGDLCLFESGAIILHLANKYGKLTPDELGVAAQWSLFANSSFTEAFFVKGPGPAANQILAVLDGLLAKSKFIAGDAFTVSDVALGGYLLYLPLFFPDLEVPGPYPNVWRYMQEVAARPTCPKAYSDGMAGALARMKAPAGGFLGKLMGGK